MYFVFLRFAFIISFLQLLNIFRNLRQHFFLNILTKFNHASYESLFTFHFYQSIIWHYWHICQSMSLSINVISVEIHPIFTIRVMWNIANEHSPLEEFFNYFLIFYVWMLLEEYFFSSIVLVKILDIIEEHFLGFTYGN